MNEKESSPSSASGIKLAFEREEKVKDDSPLQIALLKFQFEASPDGIMVALRDRRWLIANRRFREIWNLPDEVFSLGDTANALRHVLPQLVDPEGFAARIAELYDDSERVTTDEVRLIDGRVFNRHSVPLADAQRNYYGRVWYYRDVTQEWQAQRELAAEQEKYRNLFHHSNDGIVLYDPGGRVIDANDQFTFAMGYTTQELLTLRARDLHPTEALADVAKSFDRVYRDGGCTCEVPFLRKDGNTFPAEVSARKFDLVGKSVVQGIVRNIAERKSVELGIRRAREEAVSANHAKTDFLATLSHELRTPLNAVIGMTDLCLTTDLDDSQRHHLNRIRVNGNYLLRLISDLLDISKIEAGQVELEMAPFDPSELLTNVRTTLDRIPRAEGVRLDVNVLSDPVPYVTGDRERIQQVLLNYGSNALKFTKRGYIEMSLSLEAGADDSRSILHFCVSDTGIGLSQYSLVQVFDRFVQATNTDQRIEQGSGLGLNISLLLAKEMGGKVWAESELGKGSKFHFEVELAVSESPSQETRTIPSEAGRTPVVSSRVRSQHDLRVLIAEDNDDSYQVSSSVLMNDGYRVARAVDGEEAVEMARSGHYNLILMDLDMPRTSGLEAARRIRDREGPDSGTPIIAVTAHAEIAWRRRALQCGMNDFISKPIHAFSLLSLVRKWVDRRPLILAADDSADSRELLREFLKSCGKYRIVLATNGHDAIHIFRRVIPSIVLLDMEMHPVSGMDALREIREDPTGRTVPIVAVTGHAGPEARSRYLEAGCSGYVCKPLQRCDLLEEVDRQLGGPTNSASLGTAPDVPAEVASSPIRIDPEIADLVPQFLEGVRRNCERIKVAVADREFKTVRLLGHNMKGVSASYGFVEIGEIGKEVEAAGVRSDAAMAIQCAERLLSYLDGIPPLTN